MSNAALTWARELDAHWNRLPGNVDQVKAAALLLVLCDAANEELLVWLSAETIAMRTRIRSRNTISKYLGHLQDLGLIHDTGERRRAGSRDRGGAKTYRILVDPAGRDCSVQGEQSRPGEIAQSRVSNLDGRPTGEIAQSEREIAQFRGGDCSLQSEHEALKLQEKQEESRARAREEPPPPDRFITVEEFVAHHVPSRLREDLVAERPDLGDHLDAFLAKLARKRAGTGRRPPEIWLQVLWDWWRREDAPPAGAAAWAEIKPQLPNSDRASTEDPIARQVVADMGGFRALGMLTRYQLRGAEQDFLERYQQVRERRPARSVPAHPPDAGARQEGTR